MGEEKPWWADDPEIAAIRRGVMEDIERAGREPFRPDVPDPVFADILCGASVRDTKGPRRRALLGRNRPDPRRLEAAAAPPLQPTRADNSSLSILALRMACPPRSLLK